MASTPNSHVSISTLSFLIESSQRVKSSDFKDLDKLSHKEREIALKILKEYSLKGNSKLLTDLVYDDYSEIPVDIETFLTNDNYLGKAWKESDGKSKVYPYWLEVLKELFPDNVTTTVNNLIESGARGLGKSEIAVTIGLYLMHRVMCLKNPLAHFRMKPTEKICFAFMNITKILAEEIGISKFQHTVQMSPWFMSKGSMTQKNNEPYWIPPKPIDIIVGSQSGHVIGQPIYYCLDGNTIIDTVNGCYKIEDLVDKSIRVHNVDNKGNIIVSDECTVKVTGEYTEEYEIELENGAIVKCTPNHKFMLTTGEYKEAKDLTLEDDIMSFKPYGYIYKTTNLVNGKIYVGQKTSSTFLGNKYLGSGSLLLRAINKYGFENFKVELLEWCIDKETLNNKEKYYILKYNSTDITIGYNISNGGQGGNLGEAVNKKISQSLCGHKVSDATKQKLKIAGTGKHLSEEVKSKISAGNTGKIVSEITKQKMSKSAKALDRSNMKTSKGLKVITDGTHIRYINPKDSLPEGWYYGNCKTSGTHDMSKYYSNELLQKKKSESLSGANNPMFGKGYKLSGGKNGKATKIYLYDGLEFECRKYLIAYLKENVNESISENLIRAIENKSYSKRTVDKYSELIDKLSWRNKNEN